MKSITLNHQSFTMNRAYNKEHNIISHLQPTHQYNSDRDQIKNKQDLKSYINDQIAMIKYLDEIGNTDESKRLGKNVEYLSRMINSTGIVTNPLTEEKYFISSGSLKGGGATYSTAQEIQNAKYNNEKRSYNKYNLYDNNIDTVLGELRFLADMRNREDASLVMIINKCRYDLEYKNSGTNTGYFFSNVEYAFNNYDNKTSGFISKDYIGGVMHTKRADEAYGSSGYISFKVATEGKNYIVCCGFNTPFRGNTTAGISIRAEDGVTDDLGRITGHGTDPTGAVTDINALINHTKYPYKGRDTFHSFNESCRAFKVTCQFQNQYYNQFKFIIEDTQ